MDGNANRSLEDWTKIGKLMGITGLEAMDAFDPTGDLKDLPTSALFRLKRQVDKAIEMRMQELEGE